MSTSTMSLPAPSQDNFEEVWEVYTTTIENLRDIMTNVYKESASLFARESLTISQIEKIKTAYGEYQRVRQKTARWGEKIAACINSISILQDTINGVPALVQQILDRPDTPPIALVEQATAILVAFYGSLDPVRDISAAAKKALFNREGQRAQEENDRITTENTSLKDHLKDFERANKAKEQIEEQVKIKSENVDSLASLLKASEIKVSETRRKFVELRNANDRSISELRIQVADLNRVIQEKNSEITNLQDLGEESDAEFVKLRQELEQTSTDLELEKACAAKVPQLESQKEAAHTYIQVLENKISGHLDKWEGLSRRLGVDPKLFHIFDEVNRIQLKNSSLAASNLTLTGQLQDSEAEISSLRMRHAALQEEYVSSTDDNSSLQNASLLDYFSTIDSLNDSHRVELQNTERETRDLRTKLRSTIVARDQATRSASELASGNSALTLQVLSLKGELGGAEAARDTAVHFNSELALKNQELNQQLSDVKEGLEIMTTERNQGIQSNTSLTSRNQELYQQLSAVEAKLKTATTEYNQSVQSNSNLTSKNQELYRQLSAVQKELDAANNAHGQAVKSGKTLEAWRKELEARLKTQNYQLLTASKHHSDLRLFATNTMSTYLASCPVFGPIPRSICDEIARISLTSYAPTLTSKISSNPGAVLTLHMAGFNDSQVVNYCSQAPSIFAISCQIYAFIKARSYKLPELYLLLEFIIKSKQLDNCEDVVIGVLLAKSCYHFVNDPSRVGEEMHIYLALTIYQMISQIIGRWSGIFAFCKLSHLSLLRNLEAFISHCGSFYKAIFDGLRQSTLSWQKQLHKDFPHHCYYHAEEENQSWYIVCHQKSPWAFLLEGSTISLLGKSLFHWLPYTVDINTTVFELRLPNYETAHFSVSFGEDSHAHELKWWRLNISAFSPTPEADELQAMIDKGLDIFGGLLG
ncbi:hypothetical protein BGZ60DRAFT_525445 [Tricladium varicosporioides]|nr:hypothetical protein BGZ60DRAFT_525445 [Hymenoscyphus varicosporioides]